MSNSRVAVDTIKGYYYQFDYFILKLINENNETSKVCIEGIEDVDIESADENTAIQCKYYEKTEYNHSVIAKPIRFMLRHYAQNLDKGLKYKLYGYYSSGQNKLPSQIDVRFAQENFFTYTENKIIHEEHNELKLTDLQINAFLKQLDIDVNAVSFDEQEKNIFHMFKKLFNCNDFEAEYFYYNNSLRVVKDLATKQKVTDRTITKAEFLDRINIKEHFFNIWFIKKNSIETYCMTMRKQYFSFCNISPFERFFLIESDLNIRDIDLKDLLIKISFNWSNISKRQLTPYCPYVYIHNISENRLTNIKKLLQTDNVTFLDGYDFKNADFLSNSICRKPDCHNNIKLKIINDIEQIDEVINNLMTTREIYQFYFSQSFYTNTKHKQINIPILETKDILNII